ncbi:hypothetical protein NJB14197_20320, partial [Mycobacterium montefiorense]
RPPSGRPPSPRRLRRPRPHRHPRQLSRRAPWSVRLRPRHRPRPGPASCRRTSLRRPGSGLARQ